ncbi:MAG: sulfotransferase [Parvularculaceae bacterium]|nr:sulfotransferase [Parvularculaceae bacterium]
MSEAPDRIRALYLDGRYAEAVDYIRSLCKDPDARRGAEWLPIANAATNLQDYTTARLAMLRWRMEEPEAFEPLLNAAHACVAARDEKFAINSADLLVRRFPDRPESWFTAGMIRAEYGDVEQAIYELKRAYAISPALTPSWDAIARLKPLVAGDPDIDFITGLPERSAALEPMTQASAHYAAATVFDALGDIDRAFRHYTDGAALRRAGLKHDMDRVLGLMRNAVESFAPDLFDRFRGEGASTSGSIFIFGAPRSGAGLVEQILASHPRVYGAGESGLVRMTTWPLFDLRPLFVNDIVRLAEQGRRPWQGLGENFTVFSNELFRDRLFTIHRGAGLIAFAGAIRLMLPFAKMIFVDRDPVEAAWSAFRVNYQGVNPFTFDFEESAAWRAEYEATRSAWRERIGGDTLDVSYEALVADPAREIRRIVKYAGLTPDPACERFFETRRQTSVESVRRLRSPIDTSSVAASRRYGAKLDPLRAALEKHGLAAAAPRLH